MTIPPELTMLPGRVTVTVPWPLLVVFVLAPPACTIWAPAKLEAGIVIIPARGDYHHGSKSQLSSAPVRKVYTGKGRKVREIEFTLLQDSAICIDRLIDDGLSVGRLCHLLALHADLLPLRDHEEGEHILSNHINDLLN